MDLTRHQLRDLARLERELSRMSHQLTNDGYSDRRSARWTLKLADMRDQLARLAAVDDGVEPMVAHTQLLQARLVTLITERGSVGARASLGGQALDRADVAAAQLEALEARLERGSPTADDLPLWLEQIARVERTLATLPRENPVLIALRRRCQRFADRLETVDCVASPALDTSITFGDFHACA